MTNIQGRIEDNQISTNILKAFGPSGIWQLLSPLGLSQVSVPGLFICSDRTGISAKYVFDGEHHCPEEGDERDCATNFPVFICTQINGSYKEALRDLLRNLTFVTCADLNNIPPSKVGQNMNESFENKCEYVIDDCGKIATYQDGRHLVNCSYHICNDGFFKCPNYYCVPLRYVCNSRWECPGGRDEDHKMCSRQSCPGQFKCADTLKTICLAIHSTCDNFTDCPNQDDELFCEAAVHGCPNQCNCLGYIIN